MSKLLVDTNVFVYAIDKDSQYHHWSKRILSDSQLECFTSSKNVSELLTVVARGEEPTLSSQEAIQVATVNQNDFDKIEEIAVISPDS